MTSTATISQGSTVKIGTATAGAKTLTAITQANPGVFTSAAHGLAAGDVVTLAAIVGMTQLNGLTGVVTDVSTNTFTLQGAGVRNTSAYTAYSSGGTATPVAFTTIANVHTFSGGDAAAADIDVSNLSSTSKEFLLGLRDNGSFTIELDYDFADAGQAALLVAQASGAVKQFKLTLPDGHTATFAALVKKVAFGGGVDQAVKRPVETRVTGDITWA